MLEQVVVVSHRHVQIWHIQMVDYDELYLDMIIDEIDEIDKIQIEIEIWIDLLEVELLDKLLQNLVELHLVYMHEIDNEFGGIQQDEHGEHHEYDEADEADL